MSNKDLRAPDAVPVRWRVEHAATARTVVVVARLWIEARIQASRELGVDPQQLTCTRVDDE